MLLARAFEQGAPDQRDHQLQFVLADGEVRSEPQGVRTTMERIFAAYEHAVLERYRFFSYGDAMLLYPQPGQGA